MKIIETKNPIPEGAVLLLGIDPSIRACGVSLVAWNADKLVALQSGIISTRKDEDLRLASEADAVRAYEVGKALYDVIRDWAPIAVISELPGGSKSAKAAAAMNLSKGCVATACAACGAPVIWINAPRVRKSMTGRLDSSKEEIHEAGCSMIKGLEDMLDSCGNKADREAVGDAFSVVAAFFKDPAFQEQQAYLTMAVNARRVSGKANE